MIALAHTNYMEHGTGIIKDAGAVALGFLVIAPRLKTLFVFLDPSWFTVGAAIGAVLVGRAIDILYKEFKAARRRRKFPDEKDYM